MRVGPASGRRPASGANKKREAEAPRISVIMAVYEAERLDGGFLIAALESVAAQSVGAFETIVVDDGSSDDSVALVEGFVASDPDLPIELVRRAHEGQSRARDHGAARARGDWLAFLDQDDAWAPTHLQSVAPHLVEGVDLVYTDADVVDAEDEIWLEGLYARHGVGGRHPKTDIDGLLFEDAFILPGLIVVRRSLFEQLGGFDERLSGCEGDDLVLRAIEQLGHIVCVPVATVRLRVHADSCERSRRTIESSLLYWRKLVRDHADEGRDKVRARRISRRFLRAFLAESALWLDDGSALACDHLRAAREVLPFTSRGDRASFALIGWAWSRRDRGSALVRRRFLARLRSTSTRRQSPALPAPPHWHAMDGLRGPRTIVYRDSAVAHRFLDGLTGVEIGGAIHNPFHIEGCLNVDRTDQPTPYKLEEKRLCGESLHVDIVASGHDLPFADASLDYVLSSHVLEHFYDPIGAIKEWLRVVRPGGYVFMIVPHRDRTFDRDEPLTSVEELLARHAGLERSEGDESGPAGPPFSHPDSRADQADDELGHKSFWTTESFLELCSALGLRVVHVDDVDDKVGNGFTVVLQR
jgi:glycosyltransferase involved in cell wall biosynthesis